MPGTSDRPLVLVTGATGFIAGHCINELLDNGYRVRGTVRDPAKTDRTAHLRTMAERTGGSLELVAADLGADQGWADAVTGCTYVLHVASPFPSAPPKDERELIEPAVEGTRRVLAACASAGTVRRVVLTSSVAAVISGHREERTYTEADWSDLDRSHAYEKSKTLAEQAAWDLVAELPDETRFELAVINPGFVVGPMLDAATNTSMVVLGKLLNREVPGSPRIGFAVVDVRDLATAHRLAMERPEAAGNRYICAGEHVWMQDIAKFLAAEFGPQGYRIPTGRLPDWLVWVIGRFDPSVRLALNYLGRQEMVSRDKAVRELGWSLRPAKESILDAGHSMIEHGLAKRFRKAPQGAASRQSAG